jgi:hypothetical protein
LSVCPVRGNGNRSTSDASAWSRKVTVQSTPLRNLGGLLAERIADSRATQFRIRPPAVEAVCFTVFERGAGRLLLRGSSEPTIGSPATGVIRGNDPGTWSTASDGNSRLVLFVPAMLLCRRLEALLDGRKVETVEFGPAFDQTRGAAATIRRMLGFLFAELDIPIRCCCRTKSRSAVLKRTWRYHCCSACRTTTARICKGRKRLPHRAMCARPKSSCVPMLACR